MQSKAVTERILGIAPHSVISKQELSVWLTPCNLLQESGNLLRSKTQKNELVKHWAQDLG
jgi:hypothetical protein